MRHEYSSIFCVCVFHCCCSSNCIRWKVVNRAAFRWYRNLILNIKLFQWFTYCKWIHVWFHFVLFFFLVVCSLLFVCLYLCFCRSLVTGIRWGTTWNDINMNLWRVQFVQNRATNFSLFTFSIFGLSCSVRMSWFDFNHSAEEKKSQHDSSDLAGETRDSMTRSIVRFFFVWLIIFVWDRMF